MKYKHLGQNQFKMVNLKFYVKFSIAVTSFVMALKGRIHEIEIKTSKFILHNSFGPCKVTETVTSFEHSAKVEQAELPKYHVDSNVITSYISPAQGHRSLKFDKSCLLGPR